MEHKVYGLFSSVLNEVKKPNPNFNDIVSKTVDIFNNNINDDVQYNNELFEEITKAIIDKNLVIIHNIIDNYVASRNITKGTLLKWDMLDKL